MNISSNLSHWVCVLAGLYLVLTGLMMRDVLGERPQPTGLAAAHHHGWRQAHNVGRRTIVIGVGLAAALYGIVRLM